MSELFNPAQVNIAKTTNLLKGDGNGGAAVGPSATDPTFNSVTTPTISSPAGFGLGLVSQNNSMFFQGPNNGNLASFDPFGLRLYGGTSGMVLGNSQDTGLFRTAPSVLAIGNGSPGDASGKLWASGIGHNNTASNDFVLSGGAGNLALNVTGNNGTTLVTPNSVQLGQYGRITWHSNSSDGHGTGGISLIQDDINTLRLRGSNGTNDGNLSLGSLTTSGTIKPGSYTVATLPSASSYSGSIATVSNPASGKRGDVLSNGTNWLYSDNSIAA
jgi:hypothetical protein